MESAESPTDDGAKESGMAIAKSNIERVPCLSMNSITNLTPQQLRHAADIQEQIQALQNELSDLLGNHETGPTGKTKGRRRVSPQGLANIRAGARRRWAAARAGKTNRPAGKRRGKMSTAGRARIAAALRARWAAAKRAGRNAL